MRIAVALAHSEETTRDSRRQWSKMGRRGSEALNPHDSGEKMGGNRDGFGALHATMVACLLRGEEEQGKEGGG